MTGTQSEEGRASDVLWEQNRRARERARPGEARARGGWLFSVSPGVTPLDVARHYSGGKRGALKELATLNPSCVDGDRWVRWFPGLGLLLPVGWGDPMKRDPLSRRAGGRLEGKGPHARGGARTALSSQVGHPDSYGGGMNTSLEQGTSVAARKSRAVARSE